MKGAKLFLRDAAAWFVASIGLRACPGLVNAIYNRLPHSVLNWLVHHGFFGTPEHAFPWKVRLANGRHLNLVVDPSDEFSLGYAFLFKVHDQGLRRLQERLIAQMPERSVYLDIGSNIGVSSVHALSCGRHSWLFEPNRALNSYVRRLFDANHFANARFEEVALSDAPGTAEFHISKSSFLSSFDRSHAASEGQPTAVQVEMRTLDSYLPELRDAAGHIVIKIDVEGHEMAVLRGAEATLRHYHPPVMVELLCNDHARRLAWDFMSALGYACLGVVDGATLNLKELSTVEALVTFKEINFVFLPAGQRL